MEKQMVEFRNDDVMFKYHESAKIGTHMHGSDLMVWKDTENMHEAEMNMQSKRLQ